MFSSLSARALTQELRLEVGAVLRCDMPPEVVLEAHLIPNVVELASCTVAYAVSTTSHEFRRRLEWVQHQCIAIHAHFGQNYENPGCHRGNVHDVTWEQMKEMPRDISFRLGNII